MEPFDDGYGFQIASEDDYPSELLHGIQLILMLHIICVQYVCDLAVVTDSNKICSMCTYVRGFLDDNDSVDS